MILFEATRAEVIAAVTGKEIVEDISKVPSPAPR